MDLRQGPLRVPLRPGRRPAHPPDGPRRGRRAAARVVARGLRGRRPRPAGRRRRRRAHRWPRHRRGRLRLRQVRPRRRSAPTTSTSAPARTPPRRPASSAAHVALSGGGDVRRPGAAPSWCWSASSPRTRPPRSSCGCARPSQEGHPRRLARALHVSRPGQDARPAHRRPRPAPRPTPSRRCADAAASALGKDAIILVGERLAGSPRRADGRSPTWQPPRAPGWPGSRVAPVTEERSRPAACPTCCPAAVRSPMPAPASMPPLPGASTSLPATPGRDGDAIVAALLTGELGGLVVGGVDPDDTSDPAAFRAALDAAGFVVSLELRETDVTERADVVLPVSPVADKAGTFVTWEGRPVPSRRSSPTRPRCPTCASSPASPTSCPRWAGAPLGFRTVSRSAPRWRRWAPGTAPARRSTPARRRVPPRQPGSRPRTATP